MWAGRRRAHALLMRATRPHLGRHHPHQTHRTAAAVFDADSKRTTLVDPAGRNGTITRAELAALMYAVRLSDTTQRLTIFTDSQASIHLIYRALHSPHTLLECKHRHLLMNLAAHITSRASAGAHTHIHKV